MKQSKRSRQRKSAPKQEVGEPVEIEVRFSLPDPPPPAFPGVKPAVHRAKKAGKVERPGVTFRL